MKKFKKYVVLLILSLVLWSVVFESNFENDSIVFSTSSYDLIVIYIFIYKFKNKYIIC